MNTKFSYFRIYICAGVRRTSIGQAKKGGRTVIEVKNLTKRYGDHTAVDHLSFQVEEGQIYGFLGPNGAGKSTTMNMITGYIASTEGTVVINGHDILEEPEEAKKDIGYLPEQPPLYMDMTVIEYLRLAAELKKVPKKDRENMIADIMDTVQLTHMKDRLIKNLSKGYKQRTGLAQALMGYPEVIILDEPTVGLDPKQIIEIRMSGIMRKNWKKWALNINLDMIGTYMGKFISCVSAEEKLAGYISYMAAEVGFPVEARAGVYSSDSTPFADKGVPSLFFARIASKNVAPIHCRYDLKEVMSMEQLQKDIDFLAKFTERFANAVVCPVAREIPEKIKKELDEYLFRKRKRVIFTGGSKMKTRRLGKTNLQVSEIGFGGEWLERHPEEESIELIHYASSKGINILDCWMADPKSRNIIGEGIKENRSKWFIQGHIGSTWKDEQYFRTRDMRYVRPAFEDLLKRLQTDYIDLGMIHYVDSEEEWEQIQHSDYLDYVMELKNSGIIHHIGMSSHNPKVAMKAAESGYVEMILFSINPAFDMLPASENIDTMFADEFDTSLKGIDADRARLYKVCEENDVGITVMKGFAGGRLFDEKRSPFGVSLTPIQCIHYALTRPAVCSIMCGYDTKEQMEAAVAYETASEEEKDYASVIANAPFHSYRGECTYCGHCKPCVANLDIAMINKFYDLATMQPEVPATIQSHYELLEHKASECIACRACEKRCPFGVPIAERMEKTAKLFGC